MRAGVCQYRGTPFKEKGRGDTPTAFYHQYPTAPASSMNAVPTAR